MIAIRPAHDGVPAQWRLISRTGIGADVLAMAPIGRPGPTTEAWQQAVERLRDGHGNVQVLQAVDGHYQWILTGTAGDIIARSPAVYRDADSCRHGFTKARRAARATLGGRRTEGGMPWGNLAS